MPPKAAARTVASGGDELAKRVGVDEVRERALPVHLDDGKVSAIALLELRAAADVDQLELEAEVVVQRADDLERPLAEMAVGCVVDPDGRYG